MGGCNGLRFIGTLDKSKVSGIIKITKASSARTVWPRLVNQLQVKLETVTCQSGGFGHFMRMVTVNPKIWNVIVTGMNIPPFGEGQTARLHRVPWGSEEP